MKRYTQIIQLLCFLPECFAQNVLIKLIGFLSKVFPRLYLNSYFDSKGIYLFDEHYSGNAYYMDSYNNISVLITNTFAQQNVVLQPYNIISRNDKTLIVKRMLIQAGVLFNIEKLKREIYLITIAKINQS